MRTKRLDTQLAERRPTNMAATMMGEDELRRVEAGAYDGFCKAIDKLLEEVDRLLRVEANLREQGYPLRHVYASGLLVTLQGEAMTLEQERNDEDSKKGG